MSNEINFIFHTYCSKCGYNLVDMNKSPLVCEECQDNKIRETSVSEVYILCHMSKNWTEILGVYSTHEKSMEAYHRIHSQFSGSSDTSGLFVCVKKLDEELAHE